METYCVKQNIVDWNGNVMQSYIVRDGIYSLKTAQKCATELEKRNIEDFGDLNLIEGYRYTFTAESETEITKSQAKEFYRDLCGTVYGNANKTCQGVMSIALIADHMRISVERATEFCNAMIKYGVTERSNGMIVV